MNPNERIGHNIKKWRELKEIKQEVLANKLKITSAALSNIENGKTDISIKRIEQIAEVLQIDFSLLLSNPQQIINNSNSTSHEDVYNSQYSTINYDLIKSLQLELQTKNEQIAFLQKVITSKQIQK